MIEHVCHQARLAPGVDAIVVATDDARIASAVARFGGVARITAASHRTGTDRIAEVARHLACEVVINVQGDEPLIRPEMIEAVAGPLLAGGDVRMTTLRRRMTDPDEYANPNVVKVVVDRNGDALYFSRAPVPFAREEGQAPSARLKPDTTYKHIGIYAYRRDFLLEFAALPQTPLERAESLEQLRALEHGYRIRTIETEFDSIGVDTPEDLDRVRRQLERLTTATRA